MPKVFLCYYNTIDDEDARLEPTLKMEINEYFKVKQISEDETLFQVLSSFYQKEHKTPNAMYELSNNGLIFRANSRKERDEWMWALSLFIPRNLQIDLTLRVVLENVEYLMDHLHEFLAGASFFKQGSPMSAHLFLFRKYPKLRNQLSGIIREGLIGTLREFFAEEWDPAFGTAWRFFDLLISAVHARTRLSYQKKSYRGNALIPDDMVQMERRMSLVDTFRGEFGKAGSKGLRLSTGSPSAQVSNVAINSRPTPKPMDLDHHLKATLKDESGGDSKEDQGVPRRRPS
uniref:PH domain-containing protein n=2 Tax=Amorphochlora amoebiformis TaxID=1561963 RepID=A0A7S0DST6_9EUKA|mmetsp:Transcript_5161/g.7808  ORF Transcript_5161/g.7808 Transcript_5161/m.7808 type:complete len:288 (+) Transcript_5161:104-967(+)